MGPFFPSSWVRILKLFDDFFADFLSIFDKNGSAPLKKLGKRLSLYIYIIYIYIYTYTYIIHYTNYIH